VHHIAGGLVVLAADLVADRLSGAIGFGETRGFVDDRATIRG
jgi:hypothetical protein